MRDRDILALLGVSTLCLPSIGGGIALLANSLLGRPLAEWGTVSSVAVALTGIFGFPLLVLAFMLCGFTLFSQFSPRVKFVNVMMIGLALVAFFSVSFRIRC